jgi:hypothetical protein
MSLPSWLPPLACVDEPLDEAIARLYLVFGRDFKRDGCKLYDVPVQCSMRISAGELYEDMFWHLLSKNNQKTKVRAFDPCRAKRLSWCRAVIGHADDEAVTVWRDRVGRARTYLWLQEHDYLVVLERGTREDGEFAFLTTAYCVEGNSTRSKLENSYGRRLL